MKLAISGITDLLSGKVEKLGTAVDLWSCIKIKSTWSQTIFQGISIFWDKIRAIFWPCSGWTQCPEFRCTSRIQDDFKKHPDFCPKFSEITIFVLNFQKIQIFSKNFTYLRLNVPIFVLILKKNYTYIRLNITIFVLNFQKSWISSQIFCIFKIVLIFLKALWTAW